MSAPMLDQPRDGDQRRANGMTVNNLGQVGEETPGWHPSLAIVAGIVSQAASPMALIVGPSPALFANGAMRALLLQSPEVADARSVRDVCPECCDLFAVAVGRAQRGECASLRGIPIHRVVGGELQTIWLNLDFTPVQGEDDTYLAVLCTGGKAERQEPGRSKHARTEDLTALEESRIQFETLTETLPQIVWSCGADGRHDYFSKRWSEFTGILPEEITAEVWRQLVYPPHWPKVSRVWKQARMTGEPYDIDYRFRHHSGEYRWLRVMALPIRDETGQITRWCGTSTDVHEAYLVAEERLNLARELERIATQDQLTEVLTRRAFLQLSSDTLGHAAKARKATSILMMDIDHFKRINDSFGHPGGDAVLSLVAKRMRAVTNERDLIGRLGGEEFAILLPACDAQAAIGVAERVRKAIADMPFVVGENLKTKVTLSVGVTTGFGPDANVEHMLSVADKALYQAKAGGRNRTVFASADTGLWV